MAYQNLIPTKLGQGTIGVGVATLYTVPASTRAIVKRMAVCNTTGAGITLRLFLVPSGGGAGTGNAIVYDATVAANGAYNDTGIHILHSGDTIQTQAGGAGLTITVSGLEAT